MTPCTGETRPDQGRSLRKDPQPAVTVIHVQPHPTRRETTPSRHRRQTWIPKSSHSDHKAQKHKQIHTKQRKSPLTCAFASSQRALRRVEVAGVYSNTEPL